MRTLTCLVTFLLLSVGAVFAQPPAKHDYRGCLRGDEGGFRLVTNSGRTYALVGDKSQLANLADKEVMINGEEGSASDVSTGMSGRTGEATSNPTAGTEPTIQVKSANKIADQCRTTK